MVYKRLISSNLVGQVFDALKKDILSGKIKIGEKLPRQEELAAQFGVSRPVIREAQNKLSSIGLIDSQQGRGTFVCAAEATNLIESLMHKFNSENDSFKELFEVRFLLEGAIIKMAADKISKKNLVNMRFYMDHMNECVKKKDYSRVPHFDMGFHNELVLATDNSLLQQLYESIYEIGSNYIYTQCFSEEILVKACNDHQKIYSALKNQDYEKAEKCMKQHIKEIFEMTK
ncbi:MAG: FadR family transcriptional regulator [Desulfobacula sp.]|nr:FadR family transcriptional regulator [Desulfobacula sp.]